jgi:hypothetical protein
LGNSNYSADDYTARVHSKKVSGTPTFAHHEAVRTGKAKGLHPSLNPKGVKMREARDSEAHPISVPIALCNDLTGSMQDVPIVLQAKEPELMGLLLKDRAAGEKYIGNGYPAIMIAGVDDYFALKRGDWKFGPECTLQVGQFESGIEIDNDLTNLLLTGDGGGNWGESYDLFLYFLARHTAHDHWEKRKKKGHAFIIADEPLFDHVDGKAVLEVIGDDLSITINGKTKPGDIPIAQIISEVKERYWLNLIIPNQTSHYGNPDLISRWKKAIGGQNVLQLDDPTKINELIVSTISLCEGCMTLEELVAENVATGAVQKALVALSKTTGKAMAAHSADNLPPVSGTAGGKTRL